MGLRSGRPTPPGSATDDGKEDAVKVPGKKDRHGTTERTKHFKRRARRWLYWATTASVVIDPWLILWISRSK